MNFNLIRHLNFNFHLQIEKEFGSSKDEFENIKKNLEFLNDEYENAIEVNEIVQNYIDTMTVKLTVAEKLVFNLNSEKIR